MLREYSECDIFREFLLAVLCAAPIQSARLVTSSCVAYRLVVVVEEIQRVEGPGRTPRFSNNEVCRAQTIPGLPGACPQTIPSMPGESGSCQVRLVLNCRFSEENSLCRSVTRLSRQLVTFRRRSFLVGDAGFGSMPTAPGESNRHENRWRSRLTRGLRDFPDCRAKLGYAARPNRRRARTSRWHRNTKCNDIGLICPTNSIALHCTKRSQKLSAMTRARKSIATWPNQNASMRRFGPTN